MAAFVDIPTGNVHVLPAQRTDGGSARPEASQPPDTSPPPAVEWVIRDGDGAIVETLVGQRSAALRRMGVIAFLGASLPLVLYGPDGQPTGDRLPG